jgi:hypothetical protein
VQDGTSDGRYRLLECIGRNDKGETCPTRLTSTRVRCHRQKRCTATTTLKRSLRTVTSLVYSI